MVENNLPVEAQQTSGSRRTSPRRDVGTKADDS